MLGLPLIGRQSSSCFSHFLDLLLPLGPLPSLGFFVFLEVVSSSGYSARRALLPERDLPAWGSSSFLSSQSSTSRYWISFSSCFGGPVALRDCGGGVGARLVSALPVCVPFVHDNNEVGGRTPVCASMHVCPSGGAAPPCVIPACSLWVPRDRT